MGRMAKNNEARDRIIFWGSLVVAVALASLGVKYFHHIEAWTKSAGVWAPLVCVLLYIPLSLTPIPSDPLTVLNGGLFGLTEGIIISWIGNNLAAVTEFWVFRHVSRATKFLETQHRLPHWLRRWPADSPVFLIGIRLIPGFGGKVGSAMAGMYQVSWWRLIWTSALVNLIGSTLVAVGGWSLIKLI